MEVQVLKALVLGEEERGQSQYQVMCFVTKFQKGDFITADAMVKLRQKNPSTIRTPEEDRGKENYTMTGWVLLDRATPISRHVAPFCVEAQEATYVREADLRAWAELPGKREPSRGMYGNVKRLFPLPEFRATFFGEE
uniref:Out at first protein BRICHOS-like domain-containing protein n=1 Tax=Anopheles quadriannulatus TaxID=34691 RepID=A0A182XNU4_ANOQN